MDKLISLIALFGPKFAQAWPLILQLIAILKSPSNLVTAQNVMDSEQCQAEAVNAGCTEAEAAQIADAIDAAK